MTYDPREYWSRVADEIDRRGGVVAGDDTPFFRYKRLTFLRKFLGSMPVDGRSVLEVGCGPGGNLEELQKRHPASLVGCDISPRMVDLARRTGGEVVEVDGATLPFADRQFDVVFTVTVLQHNPSIDSLLEEMFRVSGGKVFLFEDTGEPPWGSGSYFLRTVSDYAEVASESGFRLRDVQVLRTRYSERTHDLLTRLLDRKPRHEGDPISRAQMALERMLIPLTARLDEVSSGPRGLTKMVFSRDHDP